MAIKLDELKANARAPRRSKVEIGKLVADPNFKPAKWQTTSAPPTGIAGWSKPPVEASEDLRRVLALPRRPIPTETGALVELITRRFGRENHACRCAEWGRECITRLRPVQAWALYEIGLEGGCLGAIGVGHGKTILDLLAPLAMRQCKLALLLVPPGLVGQLITEYELVGEHFRVPSIVVHGRTYTRIHKGSPVLHVFPYSRLCRPEATTFLERLSPDTIIADEVHKLRHADTATTSRVLRYFAAHPGTRFCGWSGSLTDSSIEDYAHLAALALRYKSPLPVDPEVAKDWARAIDPSEFPAPAGALFELCRDGEHVYDGFHRRLVETRGVISTRAPAVDVDLEIDEREAPEIPYRVWQLLQDVRQTWVRPDGEEFVDALAVARCARELACGFYYRWIFPRGESVETIEEWLEARKQWRRELRQKLRQREPHLDSPHLCALAAERYERARAGEPYNDELPLWHAETWPRWKRAKGTVIPETEAVRVDDYLARDAAEWALANLGIVWYEHKAFGEWVAEISGLPLHGGGPKAGELISAEKGDRSIIASIHSHGTGRDGLQRLFAHQLVANPPSSPTKWEQMLGRLHRIGQKSETVHALFYRHTNELREHIDKALSRALYVQGTLGSTQKLRSGFLGIDGQ